MTIPWKFFSFIHFYAKYKFCEYNIDLKFVYKLLTTDKVIKYISGVNSMFKNTKSFPNFSVHALIEGIESSDGIVFSLLSVQGVLFPHLFNYDDRKVSQTVTWQIKVATGGCICVLVHNITTMVR